MIAMQVNATKFSKTSEFRTLGAMLAGDLADRMRANRTAYLTGAYSLTIAYPNAPTTADVTTANACLGTGPDCTPQQIAQSDLADWRLALARSMPGGSAWISNVDTTDNAVDVWLIWSEAAARNAAAADRNADECPSAILQPNATVTPRCMYFRINL
jgi:type IV pilus assembly protein PilV